MLDPKVMVPTQCPYSLQTVMNDFLLCRKGHYTVHVICRGSEKWILRNDKAVFVLDEPRTKKKPIPKLHMFFLLLAILLIHSPNLNDQENLVPPSLGSTQGGFTSHGFL